MRNLFFALMMTSSTALCAFSGDSALISIQDNYLNELAQSNEGGYSLSRCHRREEPVTPVVPVFAPQYGRFQADSLDLIFPARSSGPEALVSVPFNVNLSQSTSGMELVQVEGHSPLDRAIKITVAGDYYIDFGASAVAGTGESPHLIGLSVNGVFPIGGTIAIDDLTNASTIISIRERDLPALLQVVNAGSEPFQLLTEGSFSAFLTIARLNTPTLRQ